MLLYLRGNNARVENRKNNLLYNSSRDLFTSVVRNLINKTGIACTAKQEEAIFFHYTLSQDHDQYSLHIPDRCTALSNCALLLSEPGTLAECFPSSSDAYEATHRMDLGTVSVTGNRQFPS